MKESTITQRLKVVVTELQQGSRAGFGRKVGLSTSDVRQLIAGVRKPDAALVNTILQAYPQLAGKWLIEGQGQMLVKNKWMDADTESGSEEPTPLSALSGRLARIVEYFYLGNNVFFAELAGVNYQRLVNILAGRQREPSVNDLQLIAAAVPEVNLEWLLFGMGEMVAVDKQGREPGDPINLYVRANNLPAGVGVVTLLYLDVICQDDSESNDLLGDTLFLQQFKQLPYRLKKGATVAVGGGYSLKVASTHLDLESNLHIVMMAPALVSTSEEQALSLNELLNCGWKAADFSSVGHKSLA